MPHRSVAEINSAPSLAERPLKELVAELGRNMGLLVRQEIALAKTELSEKASRAAKGGTDLGIAAALGYAGLITLLAALVLVLTALGVVAWLAATLVGATTLLVAFVILQRGKQRLKQARTPLRHTTETAKETVHWAKEHLP